ncbi:MAG: sel1 repeat family protein [Muribaculaceae bacterium]|nr:sel1 repeat family protein [Muribaculaceae bacterium]
MRILSWIFVVLMMGMSAGVSAQKIVELKKPGKVTKPKPVKESQPNNVDPIRPSWSVTVSGTGETPEALPSTEEMSALGAEAYQRNAYAEALQWCGLAARQGSADAQLILGDIYLYGKGIEEDHAEAARWYRKAAGQDVARAQLCIGTLLYCGDGVPQDYTEAFNWLSKAAEKGDAVAQFLLGEMYSSGDGVPASIEEAAKWYRLSAAQGNAAAKEALDGLNGK